MRIATVGDNCMDVYAALDMAFPGGNAVNVAVYMQRYGVEAAYIGWVGQDAYGETLRRALREKGVDVSHLHTLPGSTAVTQVELKGNDRVLGDYSEGVLKDFVLSEDDLAFIERFDIVHASIWGKVESAYPRFREHGLLTAFDFADKLADPLVEMLLPAVAYPFFSYTQDDAFIRAYLRNAHVRGARVATATLGERGSLAYDGQRFYTCGIRAVEVVDTLGAGDSFVAGFLYGIGNGYPLEHCLELGTENAARTIAFFGAW